MPYMMGNFSLTNNQVYTDQPQIPHGYSHHADETGGAGNVSKVNKMQK